MEQNLISAELWTKAADGISFAELNSDEVAELASGLSNHADRGPVFCKRLMEFPYYDRKQWTYDQLCDVVVVPYFGCLPFAAFEKSPHASVKEKLDEILKTGFHQDEPVIVIPWGERQVLLEGTLRSLWFARDREPSTILEVWVPIENSHS